MKKIFIALSVLAVLGFSIAPALANVPGARDIAPGSAFKSYFLVSEQRVSQGSGPSTLFQISETKGWVGLSGLNTVVWTQMHFNVYDINSNWVFDFKIPITKWQTLLMDFGKILKDYQEVVSQLAVTFEGQSYYAGYIVVVVDRPVGLDNILVDVIQADLSSGIAVGANVLMRAYVDQAIACTTINAVAGPWPAVLSGVGYNIGSLNYEAFTGASMAAATELVWGRACPAIAGFATNGWFAMYPRYLINDANANTYWILLRSTLTDTTYTGKKLEFLPFHTWVINGAEDWRSVTINIREMALLSAKSIVPTVLKVSYPYIGQVNLKIPGDINQETGGYVPPRGALFVDLVGWNWKMAKSATGSLNWGAMTLMAADAGTSGLGAYPQ